MMVTIRNITDQHRDPLHPASLHIFCSTSTNCFLISLKYIKYSKKAWWESSTPDYIRTLQCPPVAYDVGLPLKQNHSIEVWQLTAVGLHLLLGKIVLLPAIGISSRVILHVVDLSLRCCHDASTCFTCKIKLLRVVKVMNLLLWVGIRCRTSFAMLSAFSFHHIHEWPGIDARTSGFNIHSTQCL